MNIIASNATTAVARGNPYIETAMSGRYAVWSGSVLIDMDASDTCTSQVTVSNGSAVVDIGISSFSGFLVA